MTVIDTRDARSVQCPGGMEVCVNLEVLRDSSSPSKAAEAQRELTRVRAALAGCGMSDRSTARVVAVLARYAFLATDCGSPARQLLWRMYAADGIPPAILADLTWRHLTPDGRQARVTLAEGVLSFDLSPGTRRLLHHMHSAQGVSNGDLLFRQRDSTPWDAEQLGELLARMTCPSATRATPSDHRGRGWRSR